MDWKDRTRGRISQEHVEFSSDSQLNHFEFGKPPNMKFLGKLAFQVLKFAKDLWQIIRSTRRFLVLYLMFLIFSFCCQALRCLLPKKKQTSPSFDNSKSRSSRFSQIQFQACWISSSLLSKCHKRTRFLNCYYYVTLHLIPSNFAV